MIPAKEEVRRLLELPPDDVSLEDIQYHIYVRQKIERGLEDIKAGRTISDEELETKDIEVARTVRWTETATTDLEEVVEFIARDSRFYAAALVREARAGANSLRTFADRGRVVLYGQEYADPALMRIRLNIVMCL